MAGQTPTADGAGASRTPLTPDTIADAALRVIGDEGPDALSFRRLAAELGVTQTTVHRHCGDTAGLLDMCADRIAADLPDLPPGTPWADATEQRFTALYELMVRHPGLVALCRGRPWLGPRLLARLVEPSLAANRAAGMTPRHMILAYRRMYLFTLACAGLVDHRDPNRAVARARTAFAALDPDEFPTISGELPAILDAVVDHEVFHGGLRHLITAHDPAR